MPSIFEYTDFRKYLKDYYLQFKKDRPDFSYQKFASMAGFKDKSNLYGLVSGYRNLTQSNIIRVSQALKHKRAEAEYFNSLVGFNQAKKLHARNHFYERLNKVKGRNTSKARLLRQDQFEYFAKWYHCTIRALIDIHPVKNDFTRLARMTRPPITPRQARESVFLLERLGLIKKQKNGAYAVTNKIVTTGVDVQSYALQMFHVSTAQLAQNAIADLPRNKRNISGLTLGISEKTYQKICAKLYAAQNGIMALAQKDKDADRVYQLNFHFFPVSKI